MSSSFGFAEEDGLQAKTLAVFTVLSRLRDDWGGALIVSIGLGELGMAVALAAHVAAATCLCVESDSAVCRAAMRAGACDFLVNTVDESLRVLKNEIRRRRPLSVALKLEAGAALEELLERGVLPQVFTATARLEQTAVEEAARQFGEQGAAIVDFEGTLGEAPSRIDAQSMLEGVNPSSFRFADADELRSFDERLLAAAATEPQRRWAATAPRSFHRERPFRRVVLLT